MIDLHYWPTPNGHKITLFLEETGLPYKIIPVNIGKGDQVNPDFLKIAPNNRMPAIVDHDPADKGEPISVFESGAILMYPATRSASSCRRLGCPRPQDRDGMAVLADGRAGPMSGRTPISSNTRRRSCPTRSAATTRRSTASMA